MDVKFKDGKMETGIPPLQRIFVPVEKRNIHNNWVFRTVDREQYERDSQTGMIRRATPKVRGKTARRADKLRRRMSK